MGVGAIREARTSRLVSFCIRSRKIYTNKLKNWHSPNANSSVCLCIKTNTFCYRKNTYLEYTPDFNPKIWSTLQMFRFLTETYHRLVDELSFSKTRYLYPLFQLRNRLTGLIGARGVGKTTLILQYIKNELFKEGKSFYFSA